MLTELGITWAGSGVMLTDLGIIWAGSGKGQSTKHVGYSKRSGKICTLAGTILGKGTSPLMESLMIKSTEKGHVFL